MSSNHDLVKKSYDLNSFEVQQILAMILREPATPHMEIIKEAFPNSGYHIQSELLSALQRGFEKILSIDMSRGGPKLTDRLQYCWSIIRKSTITIRRHGKEALIKGAHPEKIRIIFKDILGADVYLHDCFLNQLYKSLCLEANGGFINFYYSFLAASKPKQLKIAINVDNIRRVITWIIRRNRFRYVEFAGDQRQIHFRYLIKAVKDELPQWVNSAELRDFPNLTFEIENIVNDWLRYSCLEGDGWPGDPSEQREIVKLFIKENELVNKVHVEEYHIDSALQHRISGLEKELEELAEENRKLSNELESQKSKHEEKNREVQPIDDFQILASRELQEFLSIIDSKYSFDVLRDIQFQDDHSLTLKNFLSHFFYGLRKKGFFSYPDTDRFELTYDDSGLFECQDFVIPPNGTVLVQLQKKGWALKKNQRIFPLRKAIVIRA